jgi:hypothetical protein
MREIQLRGCAALAGRSAVTRYHAADRKPSMLKTAPRLALADSCEAFVEDSATLE